MQLPSIKDLLLPEFLQKGWGSELITQLSQHQNISVKGFSGSSIALFIAEIFLIQKKSILFIVDEKEDAFYHTTELEELIGEKNVLYFPATHVEPYEIEKTQNANIVLRTEVVNRLHTDMLPKIIVANAAALSEKVIKKEDFKALSHTIKTGDQLDFNFVDELLNHFQFNQTDFVSEPGEFSVRGGIVDVFSYANEKPYRISFFGNEVESIKTFNIETQLTEEKVEQMQLISNMNFSVSGSKVSLMELLPKDALIISKNAFLCQKKIKEFYGKAEEKYKTLTQNIKQQEPSELFLDEENFIGGLGCFQFIDFSAVSIRDRKSVV